MQKFMKVMSILFVTLSACTMTPQAPAPVAQKNEAPPPMPSKEEMMAKWMEYATPSEGHKALEVLIGRWNYSMQWWSDPKAPPEVTKGTAVMHWILGKRFVEHVVTGKFMGKPFEGRGICGYDNATKQYQSVWIDNTGTGMMLGAGTLDPKSNQLSENGNASCPFKGTMPYRAVTTLVDKNHFRYELFMNGMGSVETKVMAIEYTRIK